MSRFVRPFRPLRAVVTLALALVAAAVAAPASPARAADDGGGLRLETQVPGSALAFAAFEDIGAWGARWQATGLAKLFADPDMKAFFAPVEEDVGRMLAQGDDVESPIPPEVREVFAQVQGLKGQAAVALVEMPEDGMPVVAAALDFGGNLSHFVTFLKRMKARQADLPLATEERDGSTWWSMGDPDHPDMVGTTLGTSVIVSTSRPWVDGIVARKASPLAASLGGLPAFASARRTSGDGTALFVFGNVPALLGRFVTPHAPREVTGMLEALGMNAMRGCSYAFGFRGETFRETMVLDMPGDQGLLSLFKTPPVSRKGLASAPATAFFFGESALPMTRLLSALRPVLGSVEPRMVEKLDQGLADAKAATGVDLEKDLLPLLSDELSYYVGMPETGGLYPEVVLSVGVKDPAAFEATAAKAVEGLLATLGKSERVTGTQRVVEWRGRRLYMIDLAGASRRDMVPFTPTWAVLDGRWTLTLVPHAMKELILRQAAGGKGLAGEADVAALLKHTPSDATSFGYVDLQALLTLLYDTAAPLLQTMAKPNVVPMPVRLDFGMLPPTRAVRPHLQSLATHTQVVGDAFVMRVDSPIGYLLPIMVGAGAGAAYFAARQHSMMETDVVFPDEPMGGDFRHRIAEMQAETLADAVGSHYLALGRLPKSLSELTTLHAPGADEPFLAFLPGDPWGGDYAFRVLDEKTGRFEVRSPGPDRELDTDDDVVVPGPS